MNKVLEYVLQRAELQGAPREEWLPRFDPRGKLIAIIGLLWGGCGKAAVISWFVEKCGIKNVVRFQGGANAGHTMVINGKKFITHLVPASVVYGGVGAIGPNCVMIGSFDTQYTSILSMPQGFREEVQALQERGITINPDHLIVDPLTSITCPWHVLMENFQEERAGTIGTTRKAIGPSYGSMAEKWRITVADCLDEWRLSLALDRAYQTLGDHSSCREIALVITGEMGFVWRNNLLMFGEWLKSVATIRRVDEWIAERQNEGENIILEGAQGALLHVLYDQPFTTSSPTWPPIGLGGLKNLIVVGVVKALPTRVGDGPFPTEVEGQDIDKLRELLGEYGATTGRPRRLGMPFLPAIREGIKRTGADFVVLTKIDPLCDIDKKVSGIRKFFGFDGMELRDVPLVWWDSPLQVWDHSCRGQVTQHLMPTESFELPNITGNVAGVDVKENLDPSALAFVEEFAKRLPVPVVMVKTGPSAQDMVIL